MNNKIPLLVMCGPTASGKTALSIELAKKFDGEVVSADSMQIYKEMNIGTAKPTSVEMQGIPHHMLDIIEPSKEYSVANYAKDARLVINDIHKRGKLPIMTGGTGLYIQAIVDNIIFADIPSSNELRQVLEDFANKFGKMALWQRLADADPALAETLHTNNLGRIIRGIEVFELTQKPLSEWQRESIEIPSPYNEFMIGLNYENRKELYSRINLRVEQMLENGLLDETKELINKGYSKTAGQAIGYKELSGYLQGNDSFEIVTDRLKQETRRYAKRQLTWMRKETRIHWLYVNNYITAEELYCAANDLVASWQQSWR